MIDDDDDDDDRGGYNKSATCKMILCFETNFKT
jgi:hypothetical protein